jgi:lipid-binding SYLF domain-containing protein
MVSLDAMKGAAARVSQIDHHTMLRSETQSHCKLLHDPTELEGTKRTYGTEPLPDEALAANNAGLAFVQNWKAGFGLSVTRGQGFLLSKLLAGVQGPAGTHGWSAPCFIHLEGLGAGLTLGYSSVQSVLILEKADALSRMANEKQETIIDPDLNFNVPILFQFHANQEPSLDYRHGTSLKYSREYSMSSGMMADLSFKAGYYKVHEDLNKAFYGPHVTVSDILAGKAIPPHEVMPLYAELAKHTRA